MSIFQPRYSYRVYSYKKKRVLSMAREMASWWASFVFLIKFFITMARPFSKTITDWEKYKIQRTAFIPNYLTPSWHFGYITWRDAVVIYWLIVSGLSPPASAIFNLILIFCTQNIENMHCKLANQMRDISYANDNYPFC